MKMHLRKIVFTLFVELKMAVNINRDERNLCIKEGMEHIRR